MKRLSLFQEKNALIYNLHSTILYFEPQSIEC